MRYFQLLTTPLFAISLSLVCNGQSPPSLVVEPEDTVAGYTGPDQMILSATLRCRGSHEDSVINWFKNDQPINTTRIPDFVITNGQLTVSSDNANRDFLEGYYFCQVGNSLGTVRSRTAWIKAQQRQRFTYPEGAKVLLKKEYAIVVQTGYLEYPLQESLELWTVRLRCGTTNLAVTCTSVNCLFWQHFSPAGRLLVQSALRFGYSDIQRVFSGCNSTSVTVTSFDQEQNYQLSYTGTSFTPRSTIKSQSVSVKVGDNATLYCVSSDPESVYTWTKNESTLFVTNSSRFNSSRLSVISGSVLQIEGVTENDMGEYKCSYTFPTVSKQVTHIKESSVKLTVYSLPTTSLTLAESSPSRNLTKCKTNSSSTTECHLIQSNSSLTILCTAEGSTPVTVQLVKDGTQLLNETNRIFHTDNNPQPGIYQCIATNKYGSHQTSIYVNVSDSPVATTPPVVPVSTSSSSSNQSTNGSRTIPSTRTPFFRSSTNKQTASPTQTTGTVQAIEDESSGDIAVIAGAAAGGVIVLLLLLILIVFCMRKRKKGTGHVSDRTGKKTGNGTGTEHGPLPTNITLYTNISTTKPSETTQSRPHYANASENMTSFGPVNGNEDSQAEAKPHRYHVLDRSTPVSDDIPVSKGVAAKGYSVLKREEPTSNVDAENEYAIAALHKVHLVPASSLKTEGEYSEPQDQLYPPDAQLALLNTDSPHNIGDDSLYTEPTNTKPRRLKKRPTPKPRPDAKPDQEYAYACPPDALRLPSVEPDHITVGDSGDEYAISLKNTLKPSAKASSQDTPEEELYAVIADDQAATRVPVYGSDAVQKSRDQVIVGEDLYAAVAVKQPGKTGSPMDENSDNEQSNMTPEHYESGDDWYAVSAKPSAKQMIDQTGRKSPSTEYRNHRPKDAPSVEDSQYATVADF